MRRNFIWAGVIALFLLMPGRTEADIIFNFDNNGDLDSGGTSETATDGTDSVTLTTVSISVPATNGTTFTSGQTSDAVVNITDAAGLLGINNNSITNTPFDTLTGALNESSTINNGESWTFNFNEDVIFSEIDFAALDGSEVALINIPGIGNFTFADGTSGDIFNDPFAAAVISAGTSITLTGGGGADTSFTLNDFTVQVVATVPEPNSLLALIGLAGLLASKRRR